MATLSTISSPSNIGVSMDPLWPSGTASIDTVLDFIPDLYRVKLTDGTLLSYIGSGLTYASVAGKVVPFAGVYSQVQLLDASGDPLAIIQAFGARNASEILQGNPFDAVFSGADSIVGGSGSDSLIGGDGNDTINGGQGNDTIAAGNSFDSLDGGEGSDTHILTHFNGGVEWDMTSGTLKFTGFTTLEHAINFENAVLGNGSNTIRGTSDANSIVGGEGRDVIEGLGGNDTIAAGNGFDEVFGGEGVDTYELRHFNGDISWDMRNGRVSFGTNPNNENALEFEITFLGNGNDSVFGTDTDNRIEGNGGDDTLNGHLGNDTLVGGSGNDLYAVDSTGDFIDEQGGDASDAVNTTLAIFQIGVTAGSAGVEGLTFVGTGSFEGEGDNAANVITGGTSNDTLRGLGGNDRLIGGTGADSMAGGADNDIYVVDNAGDVTTEALNEGTDLVQSSISHTLRANIENLTLTKTGNTNGTGNSLVNLLIGNTGDNILDGGIGADAMRGGGGNDRYTFDNAGDTASELVGEGTDTVISSVAHTLRPNFENLTIIGTATNAFGSSVANILTGNALGNILNGKEASDIMTGRAGLDTFVFDTALGATNVDRITDFNPVDDAIRLDDAIFSALPLGTLAAGAFHAGTAAADGAHRIIYDQATGRVFYDADGLGGTAQVLFAILDNKPTTLSHIDFVVA